MAFKFKLDELFCEFYSTFTIVFLTNLSRFQQSKKDPFGYATVVLITYSFFTWAGLRFSGAHFNPSVTLSYLFQREISFIKACLFILIQIGASFLAGFTLSFMTANLKLDEANVHVSDYYGSPWIGKLQVGEGQQLRQVDVVHPIQALVLELISSFFLMYFIMASIWDTRVPHNVYGFIIGAYYAVVSTSLGRITGGCMNPARVIGPAIVSGNFIHIWIYIVAPSIGCVLGGLWYKNGHLDGNKKVGEMHNYNLDVVDPVDPDVDL